MNQKEPPASFENEISPEMIDAGVQELCLWSQGVDESALIVESIFRAMQLMSE